LYKYSIIRKNSSNPEDLYSESVTENKPKQLLYADLGLLMKESQLL